MTFGALIAVGLTTSAITTTTAIGDSIEILSVPEAAKTAAEAVPMAVAPSATEQQGSEEISPTVRRDGDAFDSADTRIDSSIPIDPAKPITVETAAGTDLVLKQENVGGFATDGQIVNGVTSSGRSRRRTTPSGAVDATGRFTWRSLTCSATARRR